MLTWSTAAPALGAAFLASTVEVVEAFTIVLAVATLRGWRPAALGAGAALALLAAAVLLLGPLLGSVPIHALQLAIGVLLLVFGMSWLRKACLRHAGVIPLHDEDAIFVAQTAQFGEAAQRHQARLDWIAGITALKGVLLEGLEVVFIVIAVGAGGGLLLPASLGALQIGLRKACLRHAGVIPLHDEDAIFVAQTAQFGEAAQRHQARLDWIAGITALKGVLLEGLEVVFIVIAVGAGGGLLLPASLGAL